MSKSRLYAYPLSLMCAWMPLTGCEGGAKDTPSTSGTKAQKDQTELSLSLTSSRLGNIVLKGQTKHILTSNRAKGYSIIGEYIPEAGPGHIRNIASADGTWSLVGFSLMYPANTVGTLTPEQQGDLRIKIQRASDQGDDASAHQVMSLLIDAKVALVSKDNNLLHITFDGPVSVISREGFGQDEHLTMDLKQPFK